VLADGARRARVEMRPVLEKAREAAGFTPKPR
jgi:hypothetical protein